MRPQIGMRLALAAAAASTVIAHGATPERPAIGRGEATRSVVWASHGMVAAAQPLAVLAGVDVLRAGGSAVDAAIATNACLAVTEPTSCGLGGDLFAILWDPSAGRVVGLNASGRAPMNLTIAQIEPAADGTIPLHSPFSWTVPGAADGWFELHARYGRLPMRRVLQAAIRLADEGFPVSPIIAAGWAKSSKAFADKPGFRDVFMPGGRAPAEGEIFRNPALARTLERLAGAGQAAFYRGPIANALVRYSDAHGGCFTMRDFEEHRSTWDQPIHASYRGYEVHELPPPGQGLAVLQMLNMLEGMDLRAMGRDSPDFWHVMVEAKKLAYADRARYYADPSFAALPIEGLLSKDYARRRVEHLDRARASMTDAAGSPAGDPPGEPAALNRSDTTFLCAADASGMMVSLIQSNYTGFGSGYVVPELGFGIQNRGALFSLEDGHPNRLEPGKRPFHTIIPALVTKDGRPWLAFGVMGGDMQPQGHAQVLVNLIDFGMNLQEAGDAARFHHSGSSEPTGTIMTTGGVLHLESDVPAAIVDELKRRGHVIEPEAVSAYGGYQAILRDPVTGNYAGATEKRKDGCALGY